MLPRKQQGAKLQRASLQAKQIPSSAAGRKEELPGMGLERNYHLHSLASGWDEHVLGDISPKERPLEAMGAGPGFREQISREES